MDADGVPSCRLVAGFRKWLDVRGGGGPPTRLIKPLPAYDDRQSRLLDRYNLHTRHCPYCLGVSPFPLLAKGNLRGI